MTTGSPARRLAECFERSRAAPTRSRCGSCSRGARRRAARRGVWGGAASAREPHQRGAGAARVRGAIVGAGLARRGQCLRDAPARRDSDPGRRRRACRARRLTSPPRGGNIARVAKTDPHDPGIDDARKRAEEAGDIARSPILAGKGEVRFGTASWTDPTMTAPGVFYPKGLSTAEERLRYYASQFPMVEVDATYYALPNKRTAEAWVERTPKA